MRNRTLVQFSRCNVFVENLFTIPTEFRRTFENVWKMLRPGGTALAIFLAENDLFKAYETLHENPRYKPYMQVVPQFTSRTRFEFVSFIPGCPVFQDVDRFVPYFHRCKDPRGTLRKILEDIGFEVQHCSRREKSFIFPNKQALKSTDSVFVRVSNYPKRVHARYSTWYREWIATVDKNVAGVSRSP